MSKIGTVKLEDARVVVGPRTTTSVRHPTTAEWLAGRDGVIIVVHYVGLIFHRSWTSPGVTDSTSDAIRNLWTVPMRDALDLSRSCNADHLLVKVGDDAQTIRVLRDGDDALVVVHVHDCKYHKSMRRGMMRALKGLKEQRKGQERKAEVVKALNGDPEFAASWVAS